MESKKATWNNYLAITWGKYLPPIRPYVEECEIFKTYLSEFIKQNDKRPKVLILGSTPELRDVAYSCGIEPFIVDYSKDNYEAMGTLCKVIGKDIFIESNWLDIKQHIHEQFDFIFSEAAFNVLNATNAKKLYRICFDMLTDGGRVIAKQWIRLSNIKPDVDKLINDFRASNSMWGFYSHTCIPLMLAYYDYKNEVITLRRLEEVCHSLYDNKKITAIEWNSIDIHDYKNVDLELYIPLLKEFLCDTGELFNLVNYHIIHIANSQYHPIFVLKKEKI